MLDNLSEPTSTLSLVKVLKLLLLLFYYYQRHRGTCLTRVS